MILRTDNGSGFSLGRILTGLKAKGWEFAAGFGHRVVNKAGMLLTGTPSFSSPMAPVETMIRTPQGTLRELIEYWKQMRHRGHGDRSFDIWRVDITHVMFGGLMRMYNTTVNVAFGKKYTPETMTLPENREPY